MTLGVNEATLDAAREVAALAAEGSADVDARARWPEEPLRAAQRAGLAALTVPAELGGLGGGAAGLAAVCEILGASCASTSLCFGMHCAGAATIARDVTAAQRERFLDPICRGEHLTSLALAEPGAGVNFYLPQTGITADGTGYLLSGTKTFVTSGGHADSYVVSGVSTEDEVTFSCVLAPANTEGMTWSGEWRGFGMRGSSAIRCTLERVRVPASSLLGREGEEISYAFEVIGPYVLVALSGTYLGVATAALGLTVAHVAERSYAHSAQTPAHLPVVQHRLGEMWARLEGGRRLLRGAALEFDAASPGALQSLMAARAEVGDTVVWIAGEAMSLCGGIAYRDDRRLQQLLRDARAAQVIAPTPDTLRTWIGRMALDLPLLAD